VFEVEGQWRGNQVRVAANAIWGAAIGPVERDISKGDSSSGSSDQVREEGQQQHVEGRDNSPYPQAQHNPHAPP
jgi:hypothetical protein